MKKELKYEWKVNWKLDHLLRYRWSKVSHITKTILVDENMDKEKKLNLDYKLIIKWTKTKLMKIENVS